MAIPEWRSLIPYLGQLLPVIVGGAIAVATVWLTEHQRLKRDRQRELWQKELDRLFTLEELAGRITERLGSYVSLECIESEIPPLMIELDVCAGRFRRHKTILQAIRDLHNTAGRVLDSKRHREDAKEIIVELDKVYTLLLNACDAVINR